MAEKKSEMVKANINIKKGTLELEGPQEFVEKYLKPILKNNKPFSKAFPKPKPTVEEKDKIKQHKRLAAESFGVLSLGLFLLSLVNRGLDISGTLSGLDKNIASGWPYLALLGLIVFFAGIYLILPYHKAQGWLLKTLNNKPYLKVVKLLGWVLVLEPFGRELIEQIQTDWALTVGLLFFVSAFVLLAYGIGMSIKSIREVF
jgi:hypothetical protein